MKVLQSKLNSINDFNVHEYDEETSLFLIFFSKSFLGIENLLDDIKRTYPKAIVSGCSTAGEIYQNMLLENSCTITAVTFENSTVKQYSSSFQLPVESKVVGEELIKKVDLTNLQHLLVFSDGVHINGSDLVQGLNSISEKNVSITGGLAGDNGSFEETVVICEKCICSNCVTAIAFYGDNLEINFGSDGGWDSFGIDRKVTKSTKNTLFELDGKPALDLYKEFLGDKASDLPSAALLFPLAIRNNEETKPVVRTILGIDEKNKSLIFAGNIPKGAYVKLMKANLDRLIQGAENSAKMAIENQKEKVDLSILISCVGRKYVLKQLVEEEVDAVQDVIGSNSFYTGFYSYGEIAPVANNTLCDLHNQTMTITTISEK